MAGNYEANRRWRHRHPKKRLEGKRRYYHRNAIGRKRSEVRARWTESEIAQLWARNVPDRVLAKRLGRTLNAVQAQRQNLKRRTRQARNTRRGA